MHSIINVDFTQALELVGRVFAVDVAEPQQHSFRYLDTFDWLLYHADRALILERRQATIAHYTTLESELVAALPSKKQPRFWWEFPEGELRAYLAQTIAPRVLLVVVDAKRTSRLAQVRNDDGKIVVRLLETTFTVKTKPELPPVQGLRLEALRGYEVEYEELKQHLLTAGVLLSGASEPLLKRLSEVVDKRPGDYSAKPFIPFSPDTPATTALRELLLALLAVTTTNESGIMADLDTEFLHDYRVAGRMARSALSQLKDIWPAETQLLLKDLFSAFGALTNSLRDLDVNLLQYEKFKALLPESLHPGLDKYYKELRKLRGAEWRTVKRYLESVEYADRVTALSQLLLTDQSACFPVKKIGAVVWRAVKKRYKRIVKAGRRLTAQSPDSEYHALRIECKKLRYLLELFSSLFDAQILDAVVKSLKRLQTVLGEFNDYTIQQHALERYVLELETKHQRSMVLAAALGGLITQLHLMQNEQRQHFVEAFEDFAAAPTASHVTSLYPPKEA